MTLLRQRVTASRVPSAADGPDRCPAISLCGVSPPRGTQLLQGRLPCPTALPNIPDAEHHGAKPGCISGAQLSCTTPEVLP